MENFNDITNPDRRKAVLTLWQGLRRAAELGPRAKAREYPTQAVIIHDAAAPGFRVEDWLVEAGLPWSLASRWEDLCPLAEIKVETLFWRPAARANRASGGPGLPLGNVAALAVHLERWGFGVDPAALVAAALPAIKAKRLLTQHELTLLWWKREGGRMDMIRFPAEMPPSERGTLAPPSGYRVAAHARGLVIAGPKVGKRKWEDTLLGLDLATASPPVEGGSL
ncbi:MAG: hypothetical protein KA204_04965 [Chromatiaceae bacterium]|nr:hypothetical protein [Chromatiaceae bacterium]MBP6733504.1 hypothetical protein [Chromatiaceae bacterium]MBP6806930.1 hypothetical protein [Chromatiaceae bacterium]MBP8283091.1 hypothetical protein [Chromatiaceae bacterium]MBP8288430.1 hypothetical protein [Chromatiaceae bacterium]